MKNLFQLSLYRSVQWREGPSIFSILFHTTNCLYIFFYFFSKGSSPVWINITRSILSLLSSPKAWQTPFASFSPLFDRMYVHEYPCLFSVEFFKYFWLKFFIVCYIYIYFRRQCEIYTLRLQSRVSRLQCKFLCSELYENLKKFLSTCKGFKLQRHLTIIEVKLSEQKFVALRVSKFKQL